MRIGIAGDSYQLSGSSNITYLIAGYDERLYLKIKNPWTNNNYLTTKRFKFSPQSYPGGDN